MTKEEELKQAVATRNAKRKAKGDELPKIINEFLGNTLARAIAQDALEINLSIARENVPDTVWDELNTYGIKTSYGHYRKNLVDLIVDDVYKPYLVGYIMHVGHLNSADRPIRVTFYLNQD